MTPAPTYLGRPRRAYATVGPLLAGSALGGRAMSVLMWALGAWIAPGDPSDMLITIAAEDAFDSSAQLHRITAPTLVIGGERDAFILPAVVPGDREPHPGRPPAPVSRQATESG